MFPASGRKTDTKEVVLWTDPEAGKSTLPDRRKKWKSEAPALEPDRWGPGRAESKAPAAPAAAEAAGAAAE